MMEVPTPALLFDASNFQGFDRAVELGRRSGITGLLWTKAAITVVGLSVLSAYLVFTGEAGRQPLLFIISTMFLMVMVIAILYSAFFMRVAGRDPVQIWTDGTLSVGKKRIPMSKVGEIIILGNYGGVEIRDKVGGRSMFPDRVQFGSLNDFIAVVRKAYPEVAITQKHIHIKVRLAKRETL
jgi:hypothetical protein